MHKYVCIYCKLQINVDVTRPFIFFCSTFERPFPFTAEVASVCPWFRVVEIPPAFRRPPSCNLFAVKMHSTVVAVLAGIPALLVFLRVLLNVTQDPKEPPTLKTSVPFLEPVYHMIREKSSFHRNLRYVDLTNPFMPSSVIAYHAS